LKNSSKKLNNSKPKTTFLEKKLMPKTVSKTTLSLLETP
jgi:hypothetical protein